MRARRHAVAFGVIVAGVVVISWAVTVALRPATSSSAPPITATASATLHDGARAPLSFDLPELSGGAHVSLSSVVADRPAIVNFFASWCPICQAELTSFAKVSDQLSGRVEFLGVDTYEHDPSASRKLVEKAADRYPIVLDTSGTEVANAFGISNGLPDTFFLNASGHVVKEVIGGLTEAQLKQAALNLLPAKGS